jgi:hypothetical protein
MAYVREVRASDIFRDLELAGAGTILRASGMNLRIMEAAGGHSGCCDVTKAKAVKVKTLMAPRRNDEMRVFRSHRRRKASHFFPCLVRHCDMGQDTTFNRV